MLLIRHRINTIRELATVPGHYGVELDLRDSGRKLVLQHDPFKDGETFEDYLKVYRHAFMIVNVKSEGTEIPARRLLQKYRVRNYFFLDLSFPALVRLARSGERNIALRFSEYEPVEQCLAARRFARWVWADRFDRFALADGNAYRRLRPYFKICLVSPELQKQAITQIGTCRRWLKGHPIAAVCTKFPEKWTA